MNPCDMTFFLDEPLAQSVPLARQLAAQHCLDCGAYHGFWQHMRLMGLGKTLSGQSAHFLRAIAAFRGTEPLRVLISGCADYSALAHVLAGLGLSQVQSASSPEIVVLDRCETPLQLSRWYAERASVSIDTVCTDIRAYQPSAGFDLIITSSFLGYFEPEQRPALFAHYAALLSERGRLVFANRLRPLPEHQAVGFDARETQRFLDAARTASSTLFVDFALTDPELEAAVHGYTACFKSYPVASVASLTAAMTEGGLQMHECLTIDPALPARTMQVTDEKLSGPTLAVESPYVFVQAGRIG